MATATKKKRKNPAAVALGRMGGLAKTDKPKGFAAISPELQAEITAKAVEARWGKKKTKKKAAAKKGRKTAATQS